MPKKDSSKLIQEGDIVQTKLGPGQFVAPSIEGMQQVFNKPFDGQTEPYRPMRLVRKHLKINVSAEYSNKTFAAMTFGCDIEASCATPEEERKLAAHVYKSTMADLKAAIKEERDPVARNLWQRLLRQLALERETEKTRQQLKAEKATKAAMRNEEDS